MSEVTVDSVVCRTHEAIGSKVDEETVMMSIRNGKYYGLDAVGTRVWELVAEPVRVSSLCEQLCEEFDVEVVQCSTDVLGFLNELLRENLVAIRE
jgi:hypothetical protein